MSPPEKKDEVRGTPVKKLRQACDACHQAKTKCCGGSPCAGCLRTGHRCIYSQSNRVGRPKGAKNKRKADLSSTYSPSKGWNDAGQKCAKRKKSGVSDNDNNRFHNNNDAIALPFLNVDNTTSLMHSSHQDNQLSEPLTTTSLAFSSGTDNDLFNWTNTFQMPTIGDLDYPFNSLTTNISNDSSAFRLLPSSGLESLQYNLVESISDVGIVPELNFFSRCAPTLSYVQEFGSGMAPYEDLVNRSSFNKNLVISNTHNGWSDTRTAASSSCKLPRGSSSASEYKLKIQPITPDSLVADTDSTSRFSSPLVTPTSSIPLRASNCRCLHHYAKLLLRLKDLWSGSTTAPIDVALNGVQEALKPWNHYIQCHTCQFDEDQEDSTIPTMSIRDTFHILQNAYTGFSSTLSAGERAGTQYQRKQAHAQARMNFAMGSSESTGDERMRVLEILLSKTLSKIQLLQHCLANKSSRPGYHTPYANSSIRNERIHDEVMEISRLQTLLQELGSTVRRLANDLRK